MRSIEISKAFSKYRHSPEQYNIILFSYLIINMVNPIIIIRFAILALLLQINLYIYTYIKIDS